MFIDSVFQEVNFSAEFFNLKQEQNRLIFGGVFKNTILLLSEHVKHSISNNFDLYGNKTIILLRVIAGNTVK